MKKIPVRSTIRRGNSKSQKIRQTSFFSSLDAAMQRGWTLGDMYDHSGAAEIVRVRRARQQDRADTTALQGADMSKTKTQPTPVVAPANTPLQQKPAAVKQKNVILQQKHRSMPNPKTAHGKRVGRVAAAGASAAQRTKDRRRNVGPIAASTLLAAFVKPVSALYERGKSAGSRLRQRVSAHWQQNAGLSATGLPLYLTARTDRYKLAGNRARRKVYARSKVVVPSFVAFNLVLAGFLLYGLAATPFFTSRFNVTSTTADGSSASSSDTHKTAASNAQSGNKPQTSPSATSPSTAENTSPSGTAAAPIGQTAATSASTATGSRTVSLPAYGATNYLPSGVPGVTTPLTTTLPAQGVYIDNKPALLTSPTGVTLN